MQENILKIIINQPIWAVFEYSTNPKNTGKWFNGIAEERTNEWPPRLGTVYENRGKRKTAGVNLQFLNLN